MIKSRRIKWVGDVARMGEKWNAYRIWCKSHKERGHWEDKDAGRWMIQNLILEKQDGVEWIGLVWLRIGTSGGLL
jgi:hypothetical protein